MIKAGAARAVPVWVIGPPRLVLEWEEFRPASRSMTFRPCWLQGHGGAAAPVRGAERRVQDEGHDLSSVCPITGRKSGTRSNGKSRQASSRPGLSRKPTGMLRSAAMRRTRRMSGSRRRASLSPTV